MVLVFRHVLLLCSSNVFLYFSFYELIWDLSHVTRLTKCGLPFLINSVCRCCCTEHVTQHEIKSIRPFMLLARCCRSAENIITATIEKEIAEKAAPQPQVFYLHFRE